MSFLFQLNHDLLPLMSLSSNTIAAAASVSRKSRLHCGKSALKTYCMPNFTEFTSARIFEQNVVQKELVCTTHASESVASRRTSS